MARIKFPVILINKISQVQSPFILFFVTVESTYQSLRLKHATPLSGSYSVVSHYRVLLKPCLSFCVCSISCPPERSESCTDCHRIHLYATPDAKLNQSFQHMFSLKSSSSYIAILESSSSTIKRTSFLSLSSVPLTDLSALSFLIP